MNPVWVFIIFDATRFTLPMADWYFIKFKKGGGLQWNSE
jgi:hypothetical protein